MMTETDDADPTDVTLLTVRAVEPGYEQDFREWFGRVTTPPPPYSHDRRAVGPHPPVPRRQVRTGPALGVLPLPARVLILALLFSTLMTYVMMRP
jgi:antibiotic biosynthesis monooxygenase (ABM) superfamily enzyme